MELTLSIQENSNTEQDIKKSHFITRLVPIRTEQDANHQLEKICELEAKATHICFAFILGDNQNIQRASDNGEPSGTAGAPILEVLKREHLTNILVVVTRYFGGIKLGAGGLIRAYGSSTSLAIQHANLVKLVDQELLSLTIDYQNNDQLNYYLQQHQLVQIDTTYTTQITTTISVPINQLNSLEDDLTTLFNGNISFKDLGKKRVFLPYIKN